MPIPKKQKQTKQTKSSGEKTSKESKVDSTQRTKSRRPAREYRHEAPGEGSPLAIVERKKRYASESNIKTRKKAEKHNIDKLVDEVFSQIDSIFMLTTNLGLDVENARKIVRDILENVISGYSSKPSSESIIKKIRRNAGSISEYIASRLLELGKLSPSRLEFVITRGGRAAFGDVEKLYKLALEYGREDLVSALRYLWNTSGPRGLLECPRCGFNSITPEKVCLVCGYVVADEYIKKCLCFDDKFEVYLKTASMAELNEVLQLGFLLLGERGVYNPRSQRARIENPVVYTIYLKRAELSRIVEEMRSRELPI